MIEQTLVALAAPILAGKLHPHIAPPNVPRPYGTYIIVSDIPTNSLDSHNLIRNAIVQIDIWSSSYSESKSAAESLATAIEAVVTMGCLQRSSRTRYEPATELHGVILEYSIWYH